jgi:hypothetical protein
MIRSARGYIDPTEAVYLQLILGGSDARRKKVALQTFAKLSRSGLRLRNPQPLVLLIRGLLYDADMKVVRWALNALGAAAAKENIGPILDAIARNRDDPDILAAGIAALAATIREDELRERLEKMDLPLIGATLLAAAQKVPSLTSELSRTRVNIDSASTTELRLSGVLVGLDRAPENLFALSHRNSDVIGALNTHPDAMTAQYSIWALTENRHLGFPNLRIPLADAKSQRPNIRAYIYRLIGEDGRVARRNHDFLVEASMDADEEARESLARGLVDTYYDGLDELMTAWAVEEMCLPVRDYVLDHMATQAVHAPAYSQYVMQAWTLQPAGSQGRARLEASARGSPLGTELRRQRFVTDSAEFLPFGVGSVTNNSFTFHGTVQGAISGSGDAQTGDITAINTIEAPSQAAAILTEIEALLQQAPGEDLPDAAAAVSKAAQAPSKSTVQSALEWLKLAKEGGAMTAAGVTALPGLMDKLHALVPFLPG